MLEVDGQPARAVDQADPDELGVAVDGHVRVGGGEEAVAARRDHRQRGEPERAKRRAHGPRLVTTLHETQIRGRVPR